MMRNTLHYYRVWNGDAFPFHMENNTLYINGKFDLNFEQQFNNDNESKTIHNDNCMYYACTKPDSDSLTSQQVFWQIE